MEQQPTKPQQNRLITWLKNALTARLLIVGFLVLVLLIPLGLVNDVIRERAYRQGDVVREINAKWGDEVLMYGPILKLPYKRYTNTKTYNENTKTYYTLTETHIEYAYIFPETLHSDINVTPKTLKRGNFESVVFTSHLNISGTFLQPSLKTHNIKAKDILWDKASVILKTTNLKGIKSVLKLKFNTNSYTFQSSYNKTNSSQPKLHVLETSVLNSSEITEKEINTFSLNIEVNGSQQLQLIPVGNTTTMHMSSNWPHPSFIGNYLPNDTTKQITPKGFDVEWNVLQVNRAFSQVHLNIVPHLKDFAFGTKFIIMVDEYKKSERSAKYGFLVIALTFVIVFLIQTISKLYVHPFQYLMIGLALILFYTLLVSISEHSSFLKAYIIAGTAVIVLISTYTKAILKNIKFSGLIALSLTALYSFIYIIIQLQDYALLVGSIGLFVILAIIMYISHKIDWQNNR